MLKSIKYSYGFKIFAGDEEIGRLSDYYFDQRIWTTRYLVIDTSRWLPDRLILISPTAVIRADWQRQSYKLDLTKDQVENSPEITEDLPVSRQKELSLINYYGWPDYWQPLGVNIPESAILFSKKFAMNKWQKAMDMKSTDNPFLRSSKEILGYKINTITGKAGKVVDYILDVNNWIFRYLVIKTTIWGKKMLLAPSWIDNINWADERIQVSIAERLIKDAPRFKYNQGIEREHETRLYDYFTKPSYWESSEKREDRNVT